MNDTPDQVKHLFRTMMMARSGEERMVMGCSMFDAARKMALASLSHLPEEQIKVELFKRFYGSDFDEKTRNRIIARILHDCA